jgi:hypothetical protein
MSEYKKAIKGVLVFMGLFLKEVYRLPRLIKLIYKIIVHQMGNVIGILKTLLMAIMTDPIICLLLSCVLLWVYIDDLLAMARG